MQQFAVDRLVLGPARIDLCRSPLVKGMDRAGAETYVLGAFNPGMTRLANGNLLLMARVAEALRTPIHDGHVHSVRWDEDEGYVLDAWPLELADTADPRQFKLHGGGWKIQALTSLSWLLPVELSPDGLEVVAVHYDKVVAPQVATARMGGGTPPILTEIAGQRGWLTLWHGVEPKEIIGIYRTYWSLLDPDDPTVCLATQTEPLIEANPELTAPLEDLMYMRDVVFTTGIVDAGDHFIVASGEADLACRITHIPKSRFG